jgi:hypothetical protein
LLFRNPVYTEEPSPLSDFSQQQMIDIVDDIIVTNNVWRGLFRRRDVTTGHNELLIFEMEFVCLNVLSIHVIWTFTSTLLDSIGCVMVSVPSSSVADCGLEFR